MKWSNTLAFCCCLCIFSFCSLIICSCSASALAASASCCCNRIASVFCKCHSCTCNHAAIMIEQMHNIPLRVRVHIMCPVVVCHCRKIIQRIAGKILIDNFYWVCLNCKKRDKVHCTPPRVVAGAHLPLLGLEPIGTEPLMSAMQSQCNAIPMVTFPDVRHHRPLAGNNYTAWWQARACKQLVYGCTGECSKWDLNAHPVDHESTTLTNRLPSHTTVDCPKSFLSHSVSRRQMGLPTRYYGLYPAHSYCHPCWKKRKWSKVFVAGCHSCRQPAVITRWTSSFL